MTRRHHAYSARFGTPTLPLSATQFWAIWIFALSLVIQVQAQLPANYQLENDWLLSGEQFKAKINHQNNDSLAFSNGLIERTIQLHPNAATVSFRNLMSGEEMIRSIRPEAELVVNQSTNTLGGLTGQVNHAYLPSTAIAELAATPDSWVFVDSEVTTIQPRLEWKRVRHHSATSEWPPKGLHIKLNFKSPQSLNIGKTQATVHYEIYDGIPALSKWITVHNQSETPFTVTSFKSEILAVVPYEDPVEYRGVPITPPNIHVETDYAFGGFSLKNSTRDSIHWVEDRSWKTQVNYLLKNPSLLEVRPTMGPNQTVAPDESFESFRAFELIYDSTERERKGLALRKLYRTIAPWVTENPLILHVVSTDIEVVKKSIDQAAACGFEMVSLSFGSGLNMENESETNLAKFKGLADYAKKQNIHLGGYSLLSSRRIKPDSDNIVNPVTDKPGGQTHGFSPALASDWGQEYFRKLYKFFTETGFLQFTHDGSYPGDFDAAQRLPLQKGLEDSQWVQWKVITEFYKWLRANGAYVRVPDYYYLSGANEAGMGYREVNWSLPRVEQQIHTRQNIFDGTWEKTPSMGWMFVPLTQYHGGGAAATIEPLKEHLPHYETMLASNLGAGVQAVYRGLRLYDSERTKQTVKKWVDVYLEYREILESDIIHSSSRRANGRSLDYFFHANPNLKTKGMLVLYNPTPETLEETIRLNLYYTGLTHETQWRDNESNEGALALDNRQAVRLKVSLPGHSISWRIFE